MSCINLVFVVAFALPAFVHAEGDFKAAMPNISRSIADQKRLATQSDGGTKELTYKEVGKWWESLGPTQNEQRFRGALAGTWQEAGFALSDDRVKMNRVPYHYPNLAEARLEPESVFDFVSDSNGLRILTNDKRTNKGEPVPYAIDSSKLDFDMRTLWGRSVIRSNYQCRLADEKTLLCLHKSLTLTYAEIPADWQIPLGRPIAELLGEKETRWVRFVRLPQTH